MIVGIGSDIVEISRIEKAIKNKSFCEHCFSSLELEYINNRPGSAAVCFAAKEAYSKALGTGIRGFSLKDIEVFHDQLNKPYIKAYNAAARDDSFKIFLTLSHCREYAVAYVVIEKTERG